MPRQTVRVAAVALVALAVGSIGFVPSARARPVSGLPLVPDVTAALLTLDDLPIDWADAATEPTPYVPDDDSACGGAAGVPRVTSSAGITFRRTETSFTEVIIVLRGGTGADVFRSALDTFEQCEQVSEHRGEAISEDGTVSPLLIAPVGDESRAYDLRFAVGLPNGPEPAMGNGTPRGLDEMQIVYIRRGDIIVALSLAAFRRDGTPMDTALIEELAARADAKLAAIAQ